MRRRVLFWLFGVVLASCATVHGSTPSRPARAVSCLRQASAAAVRSRDPDDALSPARVRAMLRDFTDTLRRRYGVSDARRLESSRRLAAPVLVPVRFHVVTAGRHGLLTAEVVADELGVSSFPLWYRLRPALDAVVVDYRSVPGGAFDHFNRGYTAVHETGHWLGLFHPFENGCVPPGDGVDDTPYESAPTLGCPSSKDTCPAPGTDPVHNFMDYAWDPCMNAFTPGQGLRIRAMWAAYRAGQPARTPSAKR